MKHAWMLVSVFFLAIATPSAADEMPEEYTPQGNVRVPNCQGTSTYPAPLPWLSVFGSLNSINVQVFNASGGNATNTTPMGDFFYLTSNAHFNEVQTFYYANLFLTDWLPARGYAGLGHKLNIYANNGSGTYYDPATGKNYLSTHHSDAVVHEVAHAVVHGFGVQPVSAQVDAERAAVWEGLSDYFAASFKNNPLIYSCGTCPPYLPRTIDTDPAVFNYANFGTLIVCGAPAYGEHSSGMILASGLWDVREAYGTGADELLIEALRYYVSSGPDFKCIAGAVVQADVERHGGTRATAILQLFAARGIVPHPDGTILGPATLNVGQSGVYSASFPQCGGIPATLNWAKKCRACPGAPSCGDWVSLGTGNSVTTSDTKHFDLQISWLDSDGSPRQFVRSINVSHGSVTPTVVINGPSSLHPGESALYSAVTTGMSPFTYQWSWYICDPEGVIGCGDAALGNASTQSINAQPLDFIMKVNVRDVDCNPAFNSLPVDVIPEGATRFSNVHPVADGVTIVSQGATVRFAGTFRGDASLTIHDVAGRRIATVWSGMLTEGDRTIEWDSSRLANGVYFYRLQVDGTTAVRKFFAMK